MLSKLFKILGFIVFICSEEKSNKVILNGGVKVKILNKLLTLILTIAVFANVVTIILGIFYFFDFYLFKLWIAELVTTLVIAGIKIHVSYMIFESEEEEL